MVSWYSSIYMYVRAYRKRNPISGYALHLSLNVLLVTQLVVMAFSFFVYTYVVMSMLTSWIQRCIYVCIYVSLYFMFLWSLLQTLCTSVVKVPEKYKADKEFDKKIKAVTPMLGSRYCPNQSDKDQTEEQNKLLDSLVLTKDILLAEVDEYGRFRYCYECCLMKPDRAHHCSACGYCVVKFDHHCPWINKCINHGNYKFFLLYLFYICCLLLWSSLTSIEALVRYFINQQWSDQLSDVIMIAFCLCLHGVSLYRPLGELLVYHVDLIRLNETTCEQAKKPLLRGDEGNATYNFGAYYNIHSVFGWGLWAFPVDTSISDGLHFSIHYTEKCRVQNKLVVRNATNTKTVTSAPTIGKTSETLCGKTS